jgi:hypothetical protein
LKALLRLGAILTGSKSDVWHGKQMVTQSSCVIYFAGDEYGPSILRQLDDCIDPLVKKVSSNEVEIYFLAGAHPHIRQRWKLLGYTAEMEKEEAIEWSDDPRMKQEPKTK